MEKQKKPIKVAAVPYLNALPLYVGLPKILPEVMIYYLPPVEAAQALRAGKVDIGLIPIFSLLHSGIKDIVALPDLGICCKGEVLSVFIGSRSPLDQINEIYLDPESQTSAALIRILAPEFFSKSVKFLSTLPGYEKEIFGKRAGLIIGDRALKLREQFPYRLDLGKAWNEFTGFPFVFALWAINRENAQPRIVDALRLSAQLGLQKKSEITSNWSKANGVPEIMAKRYLEEHIYYQVGSKEQQGIKHFNHLAIAMNMVQPNREITYYETSGYNRSGIGRKALGSI